MNFTDLKTGRLTKGWSQVEAAGRLKVSQSYLAMLEGGVRRMTPDLARRAMRVYDLAPTSLPPSELNVASNQTASETLAGDLAALGYPGLAYLRPRNWKPKNPGEVLLSVLAREDLESRLGPPLARTEILASGPRLAGTRSEASRPSESSWLRRHLGAPTCGACWRSASGPNAGRVRSGARTKPSCS